MFLRATGCGSCAMVGPRPVSVAELSAPAVRRGRRATAVASIVGLWVLSGGLGPCSALAEEAPVPPPAVQVLSGGPGLVRPGFLEALRIQLHGVARVRDEAFPVAPAGVPPIRRARAACRAHGASVALWLEATQAPATALRLSAVECAGPRRWMHLVPIVQRDAAATDRRLALKVHGLLDTLAATAPAKARASTAAARRGLGGGIGPAGQVALWVQAGLRRGVPVEATFQATLGLQLPASRILVFYTGPAFRWQPGVVARQGGDRLALRSAAPGWIWLARATVGQLALSLELAGFLRIVHGAGETAAGYRGEATAQVPLLSFSGGIGWAVDPGLVLDVRAGANCHLARRRFAVNRRVLADTGTCGSAAAAAVHLHLK